MISGAVCLSHTPLLDHSRADPQVERRFEEALAAANNAIEEMAPDVAVLFFPDHFNGFFYNVMPQFCVGVRGSAIGDFGTVPGTLSTDEELALDCAYACLDAGVDTAISYRMAVDHGAAQPLELLSRQWPLTKVVPVFINCAAPPRSPFARARALGAAVGHWAAGLDQRVVLIASGGLSHDPPLPSMHNASPTVAARLIEGTPLDHAARAQRQNRVFAAVPDYVKGDSSMLPLNEAWDRDFLEKVLANELDFVNEWTDDSVTATAGCGAHEVRTWLAAFAALAAGTPSYEAELLFYAAIKEWLTGTAVTVARPGA